MAKVAKRPAIVDPEAFFADFPKLRRASPRNFAVTSHPTPNYNCLAFVLRDTKRLKIEGQWETAVAKSFKAPHTPKPKPRKKPA